MYKIEKIPAQGFHVSGNWVVNINFKESIFDKDKHFFQITIYDEISKVYSFIIAFVFVCL